MRIISGKYGRRRLASIPQGIRPSSDRLRETLFDILGNSVVGSNWLDLFAGSGAVGIEALSRGAELVIFNDESMLAAKLIRKNFEICKVQTECKVYQLDAFKLLKYKKIPTFDFIFIDPPYSFPRLKKLLITLGRADCIKFSTSVVLEMSKKTKLDFLEKNWSIARQRIIGDSQLVFLEMSSK